MPDLLSEPPSRPPRRARRSGRDNAVFHRDLSWERDGRDWPNRAASRSIEAAGLAWHVQIMGQGPVILLIHGTGASTHSWRDLAPLLARDFTVVAPDLPGHAFTSMPDHPRRMALPGMASALAELLHVLQIAPRLVVGHSAGTAILAQLCLDGVVAPAGLIGLNGAMLPIGGLAGKVFSPLAKILTRSSLAPRVMAWQASDPAVVERLITQTGSRLDPTGLALYGRLARAPRHTAAALAMMAEWNLVPLARALPSLKIPLVLVVGSHDRAIAPSDAIEIRKRLPGTIIEMLRGLGHLAHEERPEDVNQLIRRHAVIWRLLPST